MQTEQVLLKGTLGELASQNVDQLCEFYTKFNSDTLGIQLSILAESYHSFRQDEGVADTLLMSLISSKRTKTWSLISEVSGHVLGQIILVMPATNVISEHAFSALRRVKSYLRTTMSNNRINHLMT